VKGWKKIYQACRNQKQAGESILILDKADFMQISVRRDKEGHYKLIKGRNQQEDKIFLKIYSLNSSAPKFIKQILLSIKEQQFQCNNSGKSQHPIIANRQNI
jgi:hypothetical protein